MPRTLTQEELAHYDEHGYVVIRDAVPAEMLRAASAETDRMVAVAATLTEAIPMLDLDPSHTPEKPRVRRIKSPHEHSEYFRALAADPVILDLLDPLMPSGIRIHNTKVNIKSAGHGESIEWHQDWAFYPHTNDSVLAVGIYLDDCDEDNGPMMVIPGSHKGPTYDHHEGPYYCGAMDPDKCDVDFSKAVPLMGPAGTVTIHHARLIHGSAYNRSSRSRRFLLYAYSAVDAWPLHDLKGGIEAYDSRIVRGKPTLAPRMKETPVRIPLPTRPGLIKGSIYDNQSILGNRYFDAIEKASEEKRAPAHA